VAVGDAESIDSSQPDEVDEPAAHQFLLRVDVDGHGGGQSGPERGLEHLPAGAPTYEGAP
jgi:hypothetical protein